ncbi:hypothetical protein EMCG_07312 [[Emmonsia] crescens]|uniref:Uncharacterized protein n=1 Tax=[Emmonsia] crescens TaxID=73230 RepID=A0A0G2I8R3_9EURO|nr:hypothetical protein EMCG_07312 [Emmonsia crescens UAMH 3008]
MAQTTPQPCGESLECTHEDHRLSPTSSHMCRAQSLTVNNNSRLKKADGTATVSGRVSTDHSSSHFFGFSEQSRLALQSLRLSFERERAAFAEERKLWDKERTIMKHRIAELEEGQKKIARIEKTWMASNPSGEEETQAQDVHHVWEGSSPTLQPTRVFREEEEEQSSQIPKRPLSNNVGLGLPPSLDEALSPRTRPVDRPATVGVPIELIDSSLDGITLKSTAVSHDILAKASSASPSDVTSPSSNQTPDPNSTETRKPLQITLSKLGPPEENLVRDAGHTPMTVINPVTDTSNISTEDMEFLEALDQKLLNEARKLAKPGPSSDSRELESNISGDEQPLSEPEQEAGVKFKHSTNFGSAFGTL